MVKDLLSGSSSSNPNELTAVGNMLFFLATDGVHGEELWMSDGSASGTVLVKDINSGSNSCSADELTVVGSIVFFRATDGTNGYELWAYGLV